MKKSVNKWLKIMNTKQANNQKRYSVPMDKDLWPDGFVKLNSISTRFLHIT